MSKGHTKVCSLCLVEKRCATSFSRSAFTNDCYCQICKDCRKSQTDSLSPEMRNVPKSDEKRWQQAFLDVFEYKDGQLFWTKKAADKIVIGERAGYLMPIGRRRIRVYGVSWQEHRVIFLMHHGFLPDEVDHIDCNPLNNNIENLRQATRQENALNLKRSAVVNSSGHKNVCWRKDKRKWKVEVRYQGKPNFIGYFDDLEIAANAAREARELLHGRFAQHA